MILTYLQQIFKEIDEEITVDELDELIADVSFKRNIFFSISDLNVQMDIDKSTTIDFQEFVKIMTFQLCNDNVQFSGAINKL